MAASSGLSDTAPLARRIQHELYRAMSPARKLALVSDLTATAARFTLAGLSQRFPEADESELLLRLAVLRLGADLVARAYGWPPAPDAA